MSTLYEHAKKYAPPVALAFFTGAAVTAYMERTPSKADVVERIQDQVVKITNTFTRKNDAGKDKDGVATGSGWIYSRNGDDIIIATNNHVVENTKGIKVEFRNGPTCDGTVLSTDTWRDIGAVKIDKSCNVPARFQAAIRGDIDKMRVGDDVIAIGAPFGLSGNVNAGIISAKGRSIGDFPVDDFLGIDAPINHGNSGGPTYNMRGEVVAMNTAIYSPSGGSAGIGFGITINAIDEDMPVLIAKSKYPWGYLGAQVITLKKEDIQKINDDIKEIHDQIDEMAKDKDMSNDIREKRTAKMQEEAARLQKNANSLSAALTLWNSAKLAGDPHGVLMADVNPDGPAGKTGLVGGGIVLDINGKPEDEASTLSTDVMRLKKGARVDFHYVAKDGSVKHAIVTLGQRPDRQALEEILKPKEPSPKP